LGGPRPRTRAAPARIDPRRPPPARRQLPGQAPGGGVAAGPRRAPEPAGGRRVRALVPLARSSASFFGADLTPQPPLPRVVARRHRRLPLGRGRGGVEAPPHPLAPARTGRTRSQSTRGCARLGWGEGDGG